MVGEREYRDGVVPQLAHLIRKQFDRRGRMKTGVEQSLADQAALEVIPALNSQPRN